MDRLRDIAPVLFEDDVKAVIELASRDDFTESQRAFLEQLTGHIGIVLNTSSATRRTESLLELVAHQVVA